MLPNIVLILALAVCIKWIFVILYFPFACLRSFRYKRDNILTRILFAPSWVVERMLRRGGVRFIIIQIGYIPSIHVRRFMYRCLGANIGKDAVIHYRTEIRAPYFLSIGKGSIIGDNAILDARTGLRIGRNVNLSSNVSIYSLQHDYRDPRFGLDTTPRRTGVVVEDRVWIGCNVVVLPGVRIGEGAVCCAGCVVAHDVEPYSVVAGIPARKVADRPSNLEYEFREKDSCRLY